jgi:hypothetical protein
MSPLKVRQRVLMCLLLPAAAAACCCCCWQVEEKKANIVGVKALSDAERAQLRAAKYGAYAQDQQQQPLHHSSCLVAAAFVVCCRATCLGITQPAMEAACKQLSLATAQLART